MTVQRLRAEMPFDEYVRWGVYFAKLAQRRQLEQGQGGGA